MMKGALCVLLLGIGASCGFLLDSPKKPNIVFIVADDLGFSDVGFRNGDILSPNIDELAKNGVTLENSYVQPVCSPSRTAMLSGRYPFKLGMQRVVETGSPHCLPLDKTLLPKHLKDLGYSTHMVGKWHLGFCKKACTPNHRGFNTFLGIYNGGGTKYMHTARAQGLSQGYDFWDNDRVATEAKRTYSEELYNNRANTLIRSHNSSKPFFLWVAFQNVHVPVDVPQEYVNRYSKLNADANQKKYYGMVSYMDDVVGNIVQSLKSSGMYSNTIIVFTSDNGGQKSSGANNYPFKGEKNTLYEGGVRAVTVVSSKLLSASARGAKNQGMFHASDWVPTLLTAASGSKLIEKDIDGINQWDMINGRESSSRKEVVITVETRKKAIVSGKYKLITGNAGTDSTLSDKPSSDSKASKGKRQQANAANRPNRPNAGNRPNAAGGNRPNGAGGGRMGATQLYDLSADPGEQDNLATKLPDVVTRLTNRLTTLSSDMVTFSADVDQKADPKNFDGNWSPGWC